MLFRVCNFVSPAKLLYQTAKTCQFEEKSLFFCVFFDFSYSFLFRAQRYDKKCTYASNLIISSNFIRKSPYSPLIPYILPLLVSFSLFTHIQLISFSINHNKKSKPSHDLLRYFLPLHPTPPHHTTTCNYVSNDCVIV